MENKLDKAVSRVGELDQKVGSFVESITNQKRFMDGLQSSLSTAEKRFDQDIVDVKHQIDVQVDSLKKRIDDKAEDVNASFSASIDELKDSDKSILDRMRSIESNVSKLEEEARSPKGMLGEVTRSDIDSLKKDVENLKAKYDEDIEELRKNSNLPPRPATSNSGRESVAPKREDFGEGMMKLEARLEALEQKVQGVRKLEQDISFLEEKQTEQNKVTKDIQVKQGKINEELKNLRTMAEGNLSTIEDLSQLIPGAND
uniref:Uncharacterized protein n=1 Tax=Palpitomonas bilix TaxID=652834 RepID=A0A7S3GF93_9EUKA|mmetsp:Transcript_46781/g.120569  ORF Transcript_46781/g.120569 Transcript_46781/m.120569 type:complete len:258 (+) Transcript_46781:279-1052(+)